MFGLLKRESVAKTEGTENEVRIWKKNIMEAIQSVREGKAAYLDETAIGCKDIAREWNAMLDSICEDKIRAVLGVNNLLGEVTKMDYVNT